MKVELSGELTRGRAGLGKAELTSQPSTQTSGVAIGAPYLFAEHHLVIKKEEDALLASPVRLVDPGHLPCVDQLGAAVQDVFALEDTGKAGE